MNKLPSLLGRPVELNDRPWITVILCTVIVVLALAVFEPFVYRFNSNDYLCLLFGCSSIAFVCSSLFFVVFPTIFTSCFSVSKWTIGRMYAYWAIYVLFFGTMVFLYEYGLLKNYRVGEGLHSTFYGLFLYNIASAVFVSVIPLFVTNYITKTRHRQNNIVEARELNVCLSNRSKVQLVQEEVVLEGATKETVTVNPNEVLYLESSGNYVSIVYRDGSMNRNKLLRCTIKQMEDALLPYAVFIRCHKSYIVNINQISAISGYEQGFRLSLFDTLEMIPVSNAYLDELKEALK